MESLRKFGLIDADGKPVDDRLTKVLNALLPRFRRRFPAIQDDVEITEIFEEAARRISKRERASGPIEKLGGYAWKALESIGVSLQRRSISLAMPRAAARDCGSSAGCATSTPLACSRRSARPMRKVLKSSARGSHVVSSTAGSCLRRFM